VQSVKITQSPLPTELLRWQRINLEKAQNGSVIYHVKTTLVVGFNVKRFDYTVLRGYTGRDYAAEVPTLDMLEEMKVTAILHKLRLRDPSVLSAWQVLEMATLNGAKAVGLEEKIGSLEVGKKADLIIVKTDKPHLIPMHNVPSLLVYSANGNDVDTVIVDGRVIMDHRKILTVDEEEILRKAQEAFEGLLGRSGWKFSASKMPERQL